MNVRIGDIDPVGALLGLAGLIVALVAIVGSRTTGRRWLGRALAGVAALVGIGALVALILAFTTSDPNESSVPSASPGAQGGSGVGEPASSGARSSPTLSIETSDYRRTNPDNSEYAVADGMSTLDFRFGWTVATANGPLKTDTCSVNTRLSRADGTVVKANPSNDCTKSPGPSDFADNLEPGSYVVSVMVRTEDGASLDAEKTITIRP